MTDPAEAALEMLGVAVLRSQRLIEVFLDLKETKSNFQLRSMMRDITNWKMILETFQSAFSDYGTKQMVKSDYWEYLQRIMELLLEAFNNIESLIKSTKKRLGEASLPADIVADNAQWRQPWTRMGNLKSYLLLLMDEFTRATEARNSQSREIPQLQQSLKQTIVEFPNLPFVHSISARYQRYLDPSHGLKFVPSESHKLSLDFDEGAGKSATEDLTAETISNDQVVDWLSKIGVVAETSEQLRRPSSLHLFIGKVEFEEEASSVTIPFSKRSFLSIMEKFCLPAAYLQSIFTGTARSLRYAVSDDAKTQGFVYRSPSSRTENWALAFSWDKSVQVTTGMILGLLPKELDGFLAFMKASRSDLLHPMYLPVILCEMQTDSDSDNVKRHSFNLFNVELQTRMHTYDYASSLEPSKDLDYDDVTRKLNGILSRLSFHQMRLETTLESLKYIQECEKHFRADESLAASLNARIEQIRDECRALLAEVYCNQRIAQSQLDVVYNLVVQRDNRSNLKMAAASRDIAEAAKDDSAAMRTLAFMSIVFLPATFVASFFSMSMFDWKADHWSSVASRRLWLYWVVSIPLTLFIMLIWYIWLRRDLDQERMSRHAKHNLATMGFKDISTTLNEAQILEKRSPRSYLRMRKKKYTQDQETGNARPRLHRPVSEGGESGIKPFERVRTGQGLRR